MDTTVAAYASHKYVREKLGISENQKLTIYIFYPNTPKNSNNAKNNQEKIIEDFEPFTIQALPVELPK